MISYCPLQCKTSHGSKALRVSLRALHLDLSAVSMDRLCLDLSQALYPRCFFFTNVNTASIQSAPLYILILAGFRSNLGEAAWHTLIWVVKLSTVLPPLKMCEAPMLNPSEVSIGAPVRDPIEPCIDISI